MLQNQECLPYIPITSRGNMVHPTFYILSLSILTCLPSSLAHSSSTWLSPVYNSFFHAPLPIPPEIKPLTLANHLFSHRLANASKLTDSLE